MILLRYRYRLQVLVTHGDTPSIIVTLPSLTVSYTLSFIVPYRYFKDSKGRLVTGMSRCWNIGLKVAQVP